MNLFDHQYPIHPGSKEPDTSRAAAKSVAPSAAILRGKCLAALTEFGPMTADEAAARIGISVLSARPRFSELLRLGQIEDSGDRWPNASGRMAKCWRAL